LSANRRQIIEIAVDYLAGCLGCYLQDMTSAAEPFDSLAACVSYLAKHFPDTEGMLEHTFLFRGEKECYPNTESRQCRLQTDRELTEADRTQILTITERLEAGLQNGFIEQTKVFRAPLCRATHFLQHYGLPTQFIDFSATIETAAFFAAAGKIGEVGTIAVMETRKAKRTGELFGLCRDAFAERARRQSAYSFAPWKFGDLKADAAIREHGIQWFTFTLRKTDRDLFFSCQSQLLDLSNDPVAGVLRSEMNTYVADLGKLDHSVAVWIANQVPMVPVMVRVFARYESGQPRDCEFLPPGACDEQAEKQRSIRFWSRKFPDTLPPDYMQTDSVGSDTIYRLPAT
jgi:hypothetical protein